MCYSTKSSVTFMSTNSIVIFCDHCFTLLQSLLFPLGTLSCLAFPHRFLHLLCYLLSSTQSLNVGCPQTQPKILFMCPFISGPGPSHRLPELQSLSLHLTLPHKYISSLILSPKLQTLPYSQLLNVDFVLYSIPKSLI